MDKNSNNMDPVSMLRDALNCSAHVYDKKRLLVEKHSQSVSMDVGQKKAYLNGDEVDISSALKEVRGQLVVSLEDLSNLLGYSCSFDIASNTITASDKDTSAIVPASYDLRSVTGYQRYTIRVPMVRAGRLPQPVPWSLPCDRRKKLIFPWTI